MWEVNTEAVFHCWCRVGWLKLQSSTCRRRRYVHVSLRCHLCGLNLMGMYVCMSRTTTVCSHCGLHLMGMGMYVCIHEWTWLGRDSMSFAGVGEDAEAGGVQLHRRRRQLQGGSGPSDRSARHRTIKCRVPKMSTWWDHLNIILPHVCAIQVCIYVDGGSYDDPKIDWLEADHFKWSVIIDLVWNRCCSVGYLWHCHLLMLLDTTT